MPSPFPGMNPYLEQPGVWPDFHQSFLPLMREVLNAQLLPNYYAKVEEHLYIHQPDPNSRHYLGRADVTLSPNSPARTPKTGGPTLDAPAEVRVPVLDTERSAYLEIYDRTGRHLITVIEMLSPANKKPGQDRDQYEAKRNKVLWSSTNLVEIDLLRGHPRMPMAEVPECDYCVMVCRAEEWPRAGFWPIRLRDRLPAIPVPLRPGEPNGKIDLQDLLHRLYDVAGYGLYIYEGQPDPALSRKDAAPTRQFLPEGVGGVTAAKRKRRNRS